MEHIHEGDTCVSSSSSSSSSGFAEENVEALDLLEESWFFDNLLKKSTIRLPRCYSDPCSSCSSSSSNRRQSCGSAEKKRTLARVPSLPPSIGREGKVQEESRGDYRGNTNTKLTRQLSDQNLPQPPKEIHHRTEKNKLNAVREPPRSNFLRTPSLPASIGREEKESIEEEHDVDGDIRMSKLIWQAWADSSPDLLPHNRSSKGVKQISSIPRSRPPRNTEMVMESNGTNVVNERRRGNSSQKKTLQKCLSNLEFMKIEDNKVEGRPYLTQSYVSKTSAQDMMKAQIKFWARAVATNVRQEC